MMANNYFIKPTLSVIVMVVGFALLCSRVSAQSADVEFIIDEEILPPSQIGEVILDPTRFPDAAQADKSKFQYGILDQASEPASLFNITRNRGVIYVAKRIDREELCFGISDCVLKINVLITSSVPAQFESQVVSVHFTVRDINDNAPSFGKNSVSLEVSEGTAPNSILKISGANDRDYIRDFKVKNYTLNGHRDVFELTTSKTLDGSSEIDLRLLTSLDRERNDRYQFTISAYDGGVPPLSAILFVTIEVTDKNDNPPIFLNTSYNARIDSTTPPNSVILRVSAVDEDLGKNSEISFDFSALQKPALEDTFRINSTTGEILVVGPLRPGRMQFIVEAQDNGNPPLKSQTEIMVNIISTGNTPPEVVIRTLGTGSGEDNIISILEPGGRGVFVALVDVEDDGGRDSVLCEISNEVFRMEAVPNKGYKISLQGLVDRESRSAYNLSVVCTDRGNPPLNATRHFLVRIEDANDNKPKFNQRKYSRTFTEGRKNGEYVLQVIASDEDAGKNGEIRYSIDSNYASLFNINSKTGIISAVGELDRETTPVLNFNVYATDQGNPPQQSSAPVSVTLEDINDNAPEFTQKVFYFKTREEVKGRRIINDLAAKDHDIGLNGELEFFFTGSMDGADGAFTVMTNGSIMSSSRLDREERVNYTFSVMVRDRGTPPKASSASVVIEITDINDNSPDILFPKSKNHTILISTIPETGVILSRIIAYDDDDGDNGSLKFTIVTGNEDRAFQIDEVTGELTISEASRLKNKKHYDVSIVVSDRGNPPRVNTTALKIDVFFDNATSEFLDNQKEKQEDNIIIVAIVVAITLVFSSLLVVAIYIVYHRDVSNRRKSGNTKTVFQNLHLQDNKLSTPQKTNQTTTGDELGGSNPHQYSSNKGNSFSESPDHPNSGSHHSSSEKGGPYFQERFSFSDSNANANPSSKGGKAVSFGVVDENSSSSSSGRTQTPPFSTFVSGGGGGHRVRPVEESGLFHQRMPISMSTSRQVSGARYTPVSTTCVHGDDVRSNTSADTTTSDSGRGNSVDDVTFDLVMMRDDLSPKPPMTLHKSTLPPELPGRSSTRVRFNEPEKHRDIERDRDHNNMTSGPHRMSFQGHLGGGLSSSVPKRGIPESNNPSNYSSHVTSGTSYSRPINKFLTFSNQQHRASVTSLDDDASTTTSGSYVINPDDIKLEAYTGSDVVV